METKCPAMPCSFSKSCLTIINYLQLPAVGKGQGLLGFSILHRELIHSQEWCLHTLGCCVASFLVMFPSCPRAQHNNQVVIAPEKAAQPLWIFSSLFIFTAQ